MPDISLIYKAITHWDLR